MLPKWQVQELIQLVRQRYPDWQDFTHPGFVADEISYKQATIRKAEAWLNQEALDKLLEDGAYDTFLDYLTKLAQDNNLLWRSVPSSGDTAVLHQPSLDKPTFCTQLRNLLYGDRPTPQRLQTFSDYLSANDLPNKWPFATYFLFLCHRKKEMLVKPRTARWFLKFTQPDGESPQNKTVISQEPSASSYALLLQETRSLYKSLADFGVRDMVDVQSFIWVCAQVSKHQTSRLSSKGQIELDVPPSQPATPIRYEPVLQTAVLRESNTPTPYTLNQCASDTGLPQTDLSRWLRAIERKGQAILYGPPGTGKTFLAQKLAQHLTQGKNGFWEMIQFHPAYAYEDFVQGIRPFTDDDGRLHYDLVPGRFLQFCQRASQHSGSCVLIIDEINRANLAAVFGELMVLLEYRDASIPLASGGSFHIPANVRLIGTMNTADRSIALVDHALRRRFAFIHLPPNYDVLRHYHQGTDFNPEPLIKLLQKLNRQIDDPHYLVGITYFLHPNLTPQLADIWQLEIEPYLEEYFFDQPDQVEAFRWEKVSKHLNL
ncbi:putative restriction enzyme [hydrothermal vent metagenome]|uniref:Putative restriction enzyme n=1 Tax=hydrothermal vent metagenome TaxID=652676 RepID=A0A3B0UKV0_9ZZZZ